MKKTIIILSSLVLVLTFAISGFSKTLKRKLAQSVSSDNEIGAVKIFERTLETSFEACEQNFIIDGTDKYCSVKLLPLDTTILDLSSLRKSLFLKKGTSGQRIDAALHVWHNGYAVNIMGSEDPQISKEEFLGAAKTLLTKHSKVTARFMRVEGGFESGVPERRK